MRYFTLENSEGTELDITTNDILFHEIGGLGFEEETSFRRIGEVFWLDSVNNAQTPITGKMLFTYFHDTTPYEKYVTFKTFIARAPLIMKYYPHGKDTTCYRKRVRVQKLDKSEYTELGVLDCSIEFIPYTPWYEIVKLANGAPPSDPELLSTGWIWGDSDDESSVPLAFSTFSDEDDPDATSECFVERDGEQIAATRPRFRWESIPRIDLPKNTNGGRNPIKITIHGPCTNPVWFHYNEEAIVATGGFDTSSSDFVLTDEQKLVIDNTDGQYTMKVYTNYESNVSDVYQLRDFDRECFFFMKEGNNAIVVNDKSGDQVTFEVEGHIYYATV